MKYIYERKIDHHSIIRRAMYHFYVYNSREPNCIFVGSGIWKAFEEEAKQLKNDKFMKENGNIIKYMGIRVHEVPTMDFFEVNVSFS